MVEVSHKLSMTARIGERFTYMREEGCWTVQLRGSESLVLYSWRMKKVEKFDER